MSWMPENEDLFPLGALLIGGGIITLSMLAPNDVKIKEIGIAAGGTIVGYGAGASRGKTIQNQSKQENVNGNQSVVDNSVSEKLIHAQSKLYSLEDIDQH